MSLLELIAAADERALVASGIACLDRCLPQPAEGTDPDPLRPLWAGCADGDEWPDRLAEARAALNDVPSGADGTVPAIRKLLGEAPAERTYPGLRAWADACSLLALEVHLGQDAAPAAGDDLLRRCREDGPTGAGPLVAGEVRRQIRILEMLAETAGASRAGRGCARYLRSRPRGNGCSARRRRGGRAGAGRRDRVRSDDGVPHTFAKLTRTTGAATPHRRGPGRLPRSRMATPYSSQRRDCVFCHTARCP